MEDRSIPPKTRLTTGRKLEDLEISLFLEAIQEQYGYDFHNYAQASLKRRIHTFCSREGKLSISELIPGILHDPYFFDRFLADMSITVTTMFRNPSAFLTLRENVIPKLLTYPSLKIWHAGCATGEEAYSMAILLHETGLLERSHIYATDYNNNSLSIAEQGTYSLDSMEVNAENYINAGGTNTLKDYYYERYEMVKFEPFLSKNITFAHHNLMCDGVFSEMHLILCRNVLIYFNKTLQDSVLKIFLDSLVHRGFLLLGDQETVQHSSIKDDFEEYDEKNRIFRRTVHPKNYPVAQTKTE